MLPRNLSTVDYFTDHRRHVAVEGRGVLIGGQYSESSERDLGPHWNLTWPDGSVAFNLNYQEPYYRS